MKTNKTNYKQDLLDRALWWGIDAPDRYASGPYGEKRTGQRSYLANAIKNTWTEAELSRVLRGRTPSAGEQDLAIRQSNLIKARQIQGNRSLVFSFEWSKSKPEDANVAKLCILEWLWRITKKIARISKAEIDPGVLQFIIVPEMWGRTGIKVPLHYHCMIQIPDAALDWFDQHASRLWIQVVKSHEHRGRLHIEYIRDQDQLLRYIMKQAEIDWVAQRILLPIDLAHYRDL